MGISRNEFVKKIGLAGLTVFSLSNILSAANYLEPNTKNSKSKGLIFLFQGDSITDGGRSRNSDWNHVMGHGYAYLISSRLWYDYPSKELMFYNRGVSGNKIKDLDDRWQKDTLDLKPDVLSILIGVNDVSKILKKEYTIEKWKENYIRVLERTKEALPNTMLILCEPFLLPLDWSEEKTNSWMTVMKEMQIIVRQLAKDHNTIFVELQEPFKNTHKKAPAKYWVWDGIHPMPAGHELIARLWIKEVRKKLDFIVNDF